jgi:hypothetical protein
MHTHINAHTSSIFEDHAARCDWLIPPLHILLSTPQTLCSVDSSPSRSSLEGLESPPVEGSASTAAASESDVQGANDDVPEQIGKCLLCGCGYGYGYGCGVWCAVCVVCQGVKVI